MIYLLLGENRFAIDQFVQDLLASADDVERYDGEDLRMAQLPDLLAPATLFSERRTIVVHDASANSEVWQALGQAIDNVDQSTTLIFIENLVDKRTKTYKALQKIAKIKQFDFWRDYESAKAISWLKSLAKQKSIDLSSDIAKTMVERSVVLSEKGKPVIDQGVLAAALQSLSYADGKITLDMFDAILPESTYANVFNLLSLAFNQHLQELHQVIDRLKLTDDGYQTVGLLCSQMVNLVALKLGNKSGVSDAQIAKDIGANPFALSQLKPLAQKLPETNLKVAFKTIADMDTAIKTGQLEPWEAIETSLIKIAHRV
ncbi:hypothetical protein CR956_01430 [Candidatus Saccharibacteria bacterium]|nr:MAG: hypothetical protein CR956_01430 [Candidatus Saccharibacteria bacterium]